MSLIFKPACCKAACRSKRVGQFLSKTTLQSYCAKDICTWHTHTHTHTNKSAAADCMAAVDVFRRKSLQAFNVIARARKKKKEASLKEADCNQLLLGASGVAVSCAVGQGKPVFFFFQRCIVASCRWAHNAAPVIETLPKGQKLGCSKRYSGTSYHGHQGSVRDVRLGGAACNSRDSPCLRVKNSRGDMPCRSRLSRSFTGGSR